MDRFVWIPEGPAGGIYANLSDPGYGKLVLSPPPATFDVYHARQFPTKEECQAWCDANPYPKFVPREHCFCGSPTDNRIDL